MWKQLNRLHRWNAWIVIVLALTGLLLYVPSIRGDLGIVRVWLKYLHIAAGLCSIFIILLYLPYLMGHLGRLRKKAAQLSNLWVVLFLLTGWSVSGVIILLERYLSPDIVSIALFLHDLLTWIGIPVTVYHMISRSRWMKKKATKIEIPQEWITRRTFLRLSLGAVLIIIVGPFFSRWIKQSMLSGASTAPPAPTTNYPGLTPLKDSKPPIGGGGNGQFRMYTVTEIPRFQEDKWAFTINGLVENPRQYSWREFVTIPRKVQVSDFHCVTGWSVYHMTWEGVSLKAFLTAAGVHPKATHVNFISGDGVYTDALTIKQAMMDDILIAVLMDGKPIPEELGGPVRLIIPQMYAYKSVKWLQGIELTDKEPIGYWEFRGYDKDAWVGTSNQIHDR